MTEKLSLQGLTKRYGPATVVDGLDLVLRPGEFISLLGPSGCGKTTTLRMIAGFIVPSAGRVVVDGQVLSAAGTAVPPDRRNMSMIFQSYALWPNMTVAQNVAFGLKMRRVASAERDRRVAAMLEVVQLGHLARRYPNELSGGQQQRVSLARALAVRPSVLLLDEPLSNLDANLREEMRGEIRRLHDEFGTTSVYVTHDQAEAMATSDRIAVMSKGRIAQVGDPHAVYSRPRTRYVAEFLGGANILQGLARAAGVAFPGFEVPAAALGTPARTGSYSLRPEDAVLHGTEPVGAALAVPGTLLTRSFLGGSWHYGFQPMAGAGVIRVAAPPNQVLQTGCPVWLTADPARLLPVEDD